MIQANKKLASYRLPGESMLEYKERRQGVEKAVNKYLKGQYAVVSTKPVVLKAKGVDEKLDEAIQQGQFRNIANAVKNDGTEVRIGRTKGVTYRKPKEMK